MENTKHVIFKLGNEEFGMAILYVKAIEKIMEISPVPNAPSYIEGLINLRGDVIPVYSLRRKFNLPDKVADENTKLIVTKSNGISIAFEVDFVNEIVEISEDKIHDAPKIVKSEQTAYINAVADVDKRLVILLNLDGILSEMEKNALEKLVEDANK